MLNKYPERLRWLPGRAFPVEGKEWVRVENIRQIVKRVWGYDTLLPLQEEAIGEEGSLCPADDPSGHRG